MAALIECPLVQGARAYPDAPALIQSDGTSLTYAQLLDTCLKLAHTLPDWPAGSRVALVEPDRGTLIHQIVACWYRGWIAVPLDHRLSAAALDRICRQLQLQRWPLFREESPVAGGSACPGTGAEARAHHKESLKTTWPEDQPATMTLTSGSTGAPKAVVHTFGNHAASAAGLHGTLALGEDTRWLVSLPLFHIGGLALLWRVWTVGGALVLPGANLQQALQRGITHASLVPAQVLRLGKAPACPPVQCVMLGGEAVSEQVFGLARKWARDVVISYGCSEASSTIALARSSGGPFESLPGRELAIRGEELWLSGRVLAAGYWDGENVTPLDATGQGWPTGDGARWDKSGQAFVLTGRLNRRFISGGENIQPEAIERVLLQCEGVLRAAVVPVPHPVFGQRPVAFIHPPEALDPDRLRGALAAALPPYMCPDAWLVWPEPDIVKPPLKAWQVLACQTLEKK